MVHHLLPRPNSAGLSPAGRPDSAAGTSRRTVLTRGFWAFAGAIGLGMAGPNVLAGSRLAAAPTTAGTARIVPPVAGPLTFSVYVRDVRFAAPNAKPGQMPDPTATRSPHGDLVDGSGAVVGSLAGGALPGSGGRISVQRFTFVDGTLIGMGSGALDGQEYAVVGGTGRFAGASGSYLAKLHDAEYGRDAEFVISVTGTRG